MGQPENEPNESSDDEKELKDGKLEGNILESGGIDTDERAGRSEGIDTQSEPDDETKKEMGEEREKRLDPDNRPETAEIDNSDRDFDTSRGMFTDNEEWDDSAPTPFSDPEDPNNPENADSEDSDDPGSEDQDSDDDASEDEDSAQGGSDDDSDAGDSQKVDSDESEQQDGDKDEDQD